MGPALIEPDHSDADDAEGCARDAAMGPALIEPDHGAVWTGGGMANIAAMGPALIEPDHLSFYGRQRCFGWPQWGRLSSSRITLRMCWGAGCSRGRNGAGSHRAGSPEPSVSEVRQDL